MNLMPPLPARSADCPPPLELELLVSGDAPGSELEKHLRTCAECAGYLASLRHEHDAFLEARPPELLLRKLATRAQPRSRVRWWYALVPATVAAVLLLWSQRPGQGGVQLKGSRLQITLKRPNSAATGPLENEAHPGDALRFQYAAPTDGQLVILEVDAAKQITVLQPFGQSRSMPILAGENTWLPGSAVLDETLGTSRFISVFRATPIEVETLIQQLRDGASPTCDGCQVEERTVLKAP